MILFDEAFPGHRTVTRPTSLGWIEDESGCWLWQGSLTRGYGRIKVDGDFKMAHRTVLEATTGREIPEELEVDHLCRVKHCVNPDHLEAVTASENVLRYKATITHCKNGHPRSPENRNRQGWCGQCADAWGKAEYQREWFKRNPNYRREWREARAAL